MNVRRSDGRDGERMNLVNGEGLYVIGGWKESERKERLFGDGIMRDDDILFLSVAF